MLDLNALVDTMVSRYGANAEAILGYIDAVVADGTVPSNGAGARSALFILSAVAAGVEPVHADGDLDKVHAKMWADHGAVAPAGYKGRHCK